MANIPSSARISETERFVHENRGLIRRAIRKGHTLRAIAMASNMGPRTLQKYLTKEGLFFRKPRKNKGSVIRPYKARKNKVSAVAKDNV